MADTPSDDVPLAHVARAAKAVGLELILIGNAGAALHGAPVTTLDIDFMFRDTPRNLEKVKLFAARLGAAVTMPAEPLSDVRRLVGLPVDVDLVTHISSGARFESLKSRAVAKDVAGERVLVASLDDIIAAKRAAGRPKDLAVLPILESTARVLAAMADGERGE